MGFETRNADFTFREVGFSVVRCAIDEIRPSERGRRRRGKLAQPAGTRAAFRARHAAPVAPLSPTMDSTMSDPPWWFVTVNMISRRPRRLSASARS